MPDQSVNISASGGVTIKKFSGEDDEYEYEDWRDSVKYLIRLKKLKHVLQDAFVLPGGTGKDDAEKQLIDDNDMASTWILLACTGAPKQLIKNETLAKEMLKKLDEEFDLGSEAYDLEALNAKFDALKLQDGEKPSVFFVRMDEMNAKFEKFQKKNGKEYKKDPRELLIKIASCVDEDSKYDSVIKTWKTKCTSLSDEDKLSDLKSVLKMYYKENMRESSESGGLVMSMNTVPVCSHCNKKGHKEAQCWIKHPELRPVKQSKSRSEKSEGGKKLGPCWNCGGPHRKKQCPQYQSNQQGSNQDSINGLFMGMTSVSEQVCMPVTKEVQVQDEKKDITFLADTGSMTHAICDDSIVLENEKDTLEKVQGFDGTAVFIKKKGDLTLKDSSTGCHVKLTSTRKSEYIKKNIISIGQLQSEGWELRGRNYLLTLEKGDDLLRFRKSKEENLYYMDATVVSKEEQSSECKAKTQDDSQGPSKQKVEVFGIENEDGWTKVGKESNFPGSQKQETSKTPSNVPSYGGRFAIISDDEDEDDSDDDEDSYEDKIEDSTSSSIEKKSGKKVTFPKSVLKKGTSDSLKKKMYKKDGNPIPVKKYEIDINQAHDQWGHHGERRLREMASVHGFRLTGKLNPCDACGVAKATQVRISKTTTVKATKPGERLYMDTTGPFSEGALKNKYMHGAVDDFSGKMFAEFSNSKAQMPSFAKKVVKRCENEDKPVKYIRMDGGGENKGIINIANDTGITIEITPPYTP